MGRLSASIGAFLAPALLGIAASAQAAVPADNTVTYSVTSLAPVGAGVAFLTGGASNRLYFAPGTIPAGANAAFSFTTSQPITGTLLLGLTQLASPTSATAEAVTAPNYHLVLGANVDFGGTAVASHNDFSVLFPGYQESALINDLLILNQSSGGAGYDAAYADILGFGGAALSSAGFSPPAAFSLLAFSSATLIGSGSVQQTGTPASALPEPATWAMLIGGFGVVGGMLRRPNRILWGKTAAA